MKDSTIKIISNKSNKCWEYQLSVNQAIKVGEYIKKITTTPNKDKRGTLEEFFS